MDPGAGTPVSDRDELSDGARTCVDHGTSPGGLLKQVSLGGGEHGACDLSTGVCGVRPACPRHRARQFRARRYCACEAAALGRLRRQLLHRHVHASWKAVKTLCSMQCHVTTTKQPAQVARGDKAWNPQIQPSPALSLLCTPHNISQYHTPHTTHSPYTTHHHTPHKCLSHRLSIKSKHPKIRVVPTDRSPQLQKNRHRPQTNPLKTWTLLTAKWRPPHKVLFMNFRFANAWVVQQRHGLRS